MNLFNISFNWSLQNLSSYYTDIGVVWLMLVSFVIIGLVYGILKRKTLLVGMSAVTLFGWVLWWFIGGGILWYAIGIIIWTILSFLFYIYYLLVEEQEEGTLLGYVFVIGFILFGAVQMTLNLQRVASQ
ncbi:MAG: hypothetical protein H6765_09655 [Candidatus Peribacteria bacterium]|nr:MAG: hypothetical protein H6765_09655 [Candidatus Peribacteria bacterium]